MLLNLTLFYLAQWEEYHRGVLELGYINVTEAQCMLMGIHVFTFFVGPQFWLRNFSILGFDFRYNDVIVFLLLVSFIGTAVVNFKNIAECIRTNKLNVGVVYGQLVPIFLCDICLYIWSQRSFITFEQFPNQILLGYGLIMAVLVGKVVLARVCSMHFSSIQPASLVLVLPLLNSFFHIVPETFMAYFVFIGGIACYLHLANYVIFVLSNNLCIYAFQIIPRQAPTTK